MHSRRKRPAEDSPDEPPHKRQRTAPAVAPAVAPAAAPLLAHYYLCSTGAHNVCAGCFLDVDDPALAALQDDVRAAVADPSCADAINAEWAADGLDMRLCIRPSSRRIWTCSHYVDRPWHRGTPSTNPSDLGKVYVKATVVFIAGLEWRGRTVGAKAQKLIDEYAALARRRRQARASASDA